MVVKYSEIKSSLDTGDLMLFSADFLISRLIQAVTRSAYSHVGMIARFPGADSQLCFFECTTFSGLVDKVDHEVHAGVRMVSLDKILALYANYVPGGFVLRKLEADRTADFREAFAAWARQSDARPDCGNFRMVYRYFLGKWFSFRSSDASFFCSQLVAETYQRTGLLSMDRPPNGYAPKDFSMQNKSLVLLSGAKLSEEIFVEWDGPKAQPMAAAKPVAAKAAGGGAH